MAFDRPRALWTILGLFGLVCAVLVWSFVYNAQNRFLSGAPPQPVDISASESVPHLPPIRPADPTRGSSDKNAVTVVEFADYTCLYCRLTEIELNKALSAETDVRLVWRDLPIASEHPEALLAATAGRCAAEQNRFWDMHDAMFTAQKLGLEDLKQLARQVGLSGPSFDSCLESGKYSNPVEADVTLARQYGISGAPTIFIGSQGVTGLVKADEITSALERERLKAH